MKPKLFTSCFFYGVLFSSVLFAESATVEIPVPTENPTASVFKKNSTSDVEQIIEMKLLKAKLDVIKSDQDRVISTILWTMNSFITFFIAVALGSGWLKYLSDKNAKKIQDEALGRERTADLSKIKQESREYINKLKEKVMRDDISPIVSRIESLESNFNYELPLIKLHIHKDKREKFLNTGRFDNALYESNQELKTSLETKFGGFIHPALLKIAIDLTSILELPPSDRNFNIPIRILLDLLVEPLKEARTLASTYNYTDIGTLVDEIEGMMEKLISEIPES